MSTASHHTIEKLPEAEVARLEEIDRQGVAEKGWTRRFLWGICRAHGNCKERATHRIGYRYVTGRSGRVSRTRKLVCARHASAFATKNGLEVEP